LVGSVIGVNILIKYQAVVGLLLYLITNNLIKSSSYKERRLIFLNFKNFILIIISSIKLKDKINQNF